MRLLLEYDYEHVYDYYMKSNTLQDMDPYEKIVLLNRPLKWITPIFLIVQFAPTEDMKQYLKRYFKSHEEAVASDNATLLHAACYDDLKEARERIEILLNDFNFPVDITDGAGRTACFYAEDESVLYTLIRRYGASLTCRDKDNLTPGCYWVNNVQFEWPCIEFFISQNNNINEELANEILKSHKYCFMFVIENNLILLTERQQFEYYIYCGFRTFDLYYKALEKAKNIINELPIEDPLQLFDYLINYFTMKHGEVCNQIQFILDSKVSNPFFTKYVFVKYIEMIVTHLKTNFTFIYNIIRQMPAMKVYLSSHMDYLECLIQNYDGLVFGAKLYFIAKWISVCFNENDELWSRIINFEDYRFNTILYYAAFNAAMQARDKDKEFLDRCLKLKANPNYKNSRGEPMHFSFVIYPWVFDLLLKQGIHSDAVNRYNYRLPLKTLKLEMRSLQCLSACALKNNSDLEKLPNCLVKFVSLHLPF